MQHTMVGWVEAADARRAVETARVFEVPMRPRALARNLHFQLVVFLAAVLPIFGR
jgi:hypothetical protein